MTKIVDCREYYKESLEESKKFLEFYNLKKKFLIVTNDDEASKVYVRNKVKACEYVGIEVDVKSKVEVEELEKYNAVIVQLPNSNDNIRLLDHINCSQDVDGFTEYNQGMLMSLGHAIQMPCTPKGIMTILRKENYELDGKNVVIVGRSSIVGKPLAMMMLKSNATVTICHSHTRDLKSICKQADVLVVAIGKPRYIDSSYVKKGAFVIDVGINHDENGKLCGDVDIDDVIGVADYITPVPNGVGLCTIASLISNICKTN